MTTDIHTARIRKRVLLGFARIILMILFAVVVFRILVPYLFDLHTDLGLACAVAASLLGLAGLVWFAFDFISSFRPIRRS